MRRWIGAARAGAVMAVAVTAALSAGAGPSNAAPAAPHLGDGCSLDDAGVMTLLPDKRTYAVCAQQNDTAVWAAVVTPFDPNDTWLSYGPPITLHGQAMRNPNLTSGTWTATPRAADTVCAARQQTVIEAGVLSEPQVAQGEPGKPLAVQMLPQLFYAELSGDCLWSKG